MNMKPHENYSTKEAAKFWMQKCCTMFLLESQENEASLRTSPEETVSHVSNLPEPSLRSSHPSDNSHRGRAGQKESVNLRSGLIWSLASWELVFICHGRKRRHRNKNTNSLKEECMVLRWGILVQHSKHFLCPTSCPLLPSQHSYHWKGTDPRSVHILIGSVIKRWGDCCLCSILL